MTIYDSRPGRASQQYTHLLSYLNAHTSHIPANFREMILQLRDEGVSGPSLLALAYAMVNQGASENDNHSYWLGALRNIIARSERDGEGFERYVNAGAY